MDTRTTLQEYNHVFEDRWRCRTNPDPELYSPLYDGRRDPNEDPFPFVYDEYFRLLLQMMQSVVKIWVRQRTSETARPSNTDGLLLRSLYYRLLTLPSANVPDLPCSNDPMYEACRLTSILLIRSIESNQHWSVVATGTPILKGIRDALKRTDLDGLWHKNIGLLYFVLLVFHSAAFGTTDYPFGHVVQGRVHFEVTYSFNDWHGVLLPMLVLNDLLPDKRSPTAVVPDWINSTETYTATLEDMATPFIQYREIESHG